MGTVIIGATLALSYAGYFVFHRFVHIQFSDDHKGLAMTTLGIVATINSLLLAFSAVSVWESFGNADEAVAQEANTIAALARDLAVFDTPKAVAARGLLRQYAQTVVDDEWPNMQAGEDSAAAWDMFDDLFRAIAALELNTTKQETWMYEIFARTNELLKERRTRLYTAQSRVPGTLWSVVLIGTALCMLITFVLRPMRFHVAMIGVLSLSIGLWDVRSGETGESTRGVQ